MLVDPETRTITGTIHIIPNKKPKCITIEANNQLIRDFEAPEELLIKEDDIPVAVCLSSEGYPNWAIEAPLEFISCGTKFPPFLPHRILQYLKEDGITGRLHLDISFLDVDVTRTITFSMIPKQLDSKYHTFGRFEQALERVREEMRK